ncbi:hypothetical protein OG333_37585 (plasmid) [Streptomyces anulatus]|uniref:hypothetical protein n=1 Tax=Streptomyces anulatus TaxID=1892 RepID=UPI002F9075D0|nr:hypothetical protein OG333_37585 [Streptomyces anulatus]
MPQTLTATTSSSVVITTEMLEKAAQLARDAYRPLWTGNSGEQSTGEAVARHLDATITLLDTDGWTRTWSWPAAPDNVLPATDDETSVLVQALTDNTDARFAPWAERLHRTHADITALLTAGARFARTYGPGSPASEPTAA